jgi:hypothetical protein
VISVDDYQNLRARAFPSEREPEPPPVDATLTRVDYDLRIAGDLATGRASLTVDVLKDGWVRVPNDPSRASRHDFRLSVGEATETVEVTSSAPLVETTNAIVRGRMKDRDKERDEKRAEAFAQNGASSNVFDLQKRVAGVLPVRVDVPRAGNSYRFARALVLDEETRVTFSYKTK